MTRAVHVTVTHVAARNPREPNRRRISQSRGRRRAGVRSVLCSRMTVTSIPACGLPMPEAFSTAFAPVARASCCSVSSSGTTSYFSVVTTASADLLPIQGFRTTIRPIPALCAAVIYLCDSRFSGTSFYRHRRTGYEEITEDNRRNYQLALDNDLRLHGPPQAANT